MSFGCLRFEYKKSKNIFEQKFCVVKDFAEENTTESTVVISTKLMDQENSKKALQKIYLFLRKKKTVF